jgi:NHL repeat
VFTKLLIVAVAAFLGCATDASAAPAPSPTGVTAPCNPTPSLWASEYGGIVHGFTAPFTEVCVLYGSPGQNFSSAQGLATDYNGHLYVTDTGNDRIVVFSQSGQFLYDFSTNSAYGTYSPHGVCVSRKGRIGVVGSSVPPGGPVSAEFFDRSGTLTGYATYPQFNTALLCAFDRQDDFFTDGTAQRPTGQNIFYVISGNFQTMGTPLLLSNAGSSAYWLGLFSGTFGGGNTLTASTVPTGGAGCNYCESIKTWAISHSNGQITLSLLGSCNITNYPGITNAMRQIAPNAAGRLFAADFGDAEIVRSAPCLPGTGPVGAAPYTQGGWTQYYGIAVYPTGQY